MALAISNIPILTGKVAEDFVNNAEQAEQAGCIIDFSNQRQTWHNFEEVNTKHIETLKASGQWPF